MWPARQMERHKEKLKEAIGKGINDADPKARCHSRRWARLIDGRIGREHQLSLAMWAQLNTGDVGGA